MAKKKPEKSLDQMLEEALVKEDEQPYEVPGNWVFTKLGSICTKPQYGWTTKAKQEGDVYLVRTTDITSDNLDWQNVPYCSEVPKDLSKYLLKEDDIVISRAGSIGVSYLIEKPKKAVFASYLIRFNPIINKKYVYLFLKSPIYWSSISEKSSGIALPNINATKLGEIRFPLPPLPEQKRIVKKLSSMLGKLKEARELIQEAKDTFEERRAAILNKAFAGELTKKWREENRGIMLELIEIDEVEKKPYEIPSGWKWVRLEEISQLITKGSSPKWQGINYTDDSSQVLFITSENVRDGYLNIDKEKYLELEFNYKQKRSILTNGDVLLNIVGASIGRAAIFDVERVANINQAVSIIRLVDKSLNRYLNFYLNSAPAKRYYSESKVDVARANLSLKDVSNIPLPLPPFEEQEEIVRILEKLLDHEDEARALIDMEEQIDLIEKSILSKSFSGELGTNDTNDKPAIELLKRSLKEKMNK